MEVDPNNPTPIYQQIVHRLCTAVAAGIYKPGDAIPSVRQQAVALLVNPNTVQRAYEELQRAGLLVARRGGAPIVAGAALAVALARTTDAVRNTFATGIADGAAAGLPPSEIDRLYDQAWNGSRPREPEAAR
ncbi:MAG TPA: GntR family transcriptional regulator [Tepidisphaeraceae bacterium]|nr:GntR family transcriptional regulator [Tepidisphaeraceae bacterium]